MKILLIDDDEDTLEVFRDCIGSINPDYIVHTANSGFKAICMVDNGNHYDIVISDINMPHMNGWITTFTIFQRSKNTSIYMMSATSKHILRAKIPVMFHVKGVLEKPFNLEDIENILNERQMELDKKAA